MMIKKVFIESQCSAKMAESVINGYIDQYQDENTEVDYEIIIESTVNSYSVQQVYYTVVIQLSERENCEEIE